MTDRLLSMTERYVTPFSISYDVTDCMEFITRIFWFLFFVFSTTVSAIFPFAESITNTDERSSSSSFFERKIIVSKFALVSAEQPGNAA